MTDRDAAGISRNGLRVDLAKQQAWQRRGAQTYVAKQRTDKNRARLTAKVRRDDWPPLVRRQARQRSGGICECCGHRSAAHLHHRKLRRHRDHRIVNALHVCTVCHDAIHREVALSKTYGWLVAAAADPAKVTVVLHAADRVLLTDTGRYELAA